MTEQIDTDYERIIKEVIHLLEAKPMFRPWFKSEGDKYTAIFNVTVSRGQVSVGNERVSTTAVSGQPYSGPGAKALYEKLSAK